MKKIHIHGIVGLFLAIALIFSLNATAGLYIDPKAAAVSQSIGYIMSEQYAAAQSNSRAFCSPNIRKKLAGSVQDGFYLSSVTLTDHNMSGSQGLATGMFVHQDAYQRRVYHQFSLFFQKSDTIEITDVSVEPIFNLKPITKLFIVKADRVSMADLESASFAKALEIASLNARKMDGSIRGDSRSHPYIVVAFVMNQMDPSWGLELIMDTNPGSVTGVRQGRLLNKNGWIVAVLSHSFPCDNGQELFFNLVLNRPGGKSIPAGVYSSFSLVRRIQKALSLQGYNPGPVDGRPGPRTLQAVRAFQKDLGIAVDSKLDPSLLRLILSPELPPAEIIVQRNLIRLGYDIGKIDGVLGPRSISAIHAFQQKRNLPISSQITADLLCMMSDAVSYKTSPGHEKKASGPVKIESGNRFEDRMWPNSQKNL